MNFRFLAIFLPLVAAFVPGAARAAGSFDSCTGYVNSLPATIASEGVWCVRARVLQTAQSTGAAITIDAGNVVLDCNDNRLRGTAQAWATTAIGIKAIGRSDVVVRNCRVEGFHTGAWLDGTDIAVVDSEFQNAGSAGIYLRASPGRVERSRFNDIGDFDAPSPLLHAIHVIGDVDVVDNTILQVNGHDETRRVIGILSQEGVANIVAGNRITGLGMMDAPSIGIQVGVGLSTSRTVVRDNVLNNFAADPAGVVGIHCGSTTNLTIENKIIGWTSPTSMKCSSRGDVVGTY